MIKSELGEAAVDATTEVAQHGLVRRKTRRGDIIGESEAIRAALGLIDRVARASCTVLVTGESGTGKESMVAALHEASPRASGPLVSVNCGAIPAELVESELFGHAKGAFTGAHTARRGFVAAAAGGTLFLDEVGELPLAVQVKLLRLLQQRTYVPLGETEPVVSTARIAAATNRDLQADVAQGRFREDLYFRLNVIQVHLPPLRERRADIPLLKSYFLQQAMARAERADLMGFDAEAKQRMRGHAWPGNIRALENAIERAVLVADGPYITSRDVFGAEGAVPLPPSGPRPPLPGLVRRSSSAFPRVLPDMGFNVVQAAERYQNELIRQALDRTAGNKNRAAQLLGLNRTTLSEIIRRRGLKEA